MSTPPVVPVVPGKYDPMRIGCGIMIPIAFVLGIAAHAFWPSWKPTPKPEPPGPPPAITLQEQLTGPTGTQVDLRLMLIAPVSGGVRGLAWTPVGAETRNAQEVTLLIGSTPPAPTPPGPEPPGPIPPPQPSDPLFAPAQAAYSADQSPTKAADKATLATVFRKMNPNDKAYVKLSDFLSVLHSTTEQYLPGRLKGLRSLFGVELGKYLPSDPKAVLTAEHKTAAAAQLTRYATILEGLK